MVVALAVDILVGALYHPRKTTRVAASLVNPVITQTENGPSESKIAAQSFVWKGSAHEPKRIVIPAASVDAYIQTMGIDQQNQIASPTNIYFAGWFVRSVTPGQKGLAIIDGHLDGKTQSKGVFANLDQLKPGDALSIERGDGTTLKYTVFSLKTVKNSDAHDLLFSEDPSVISQLNLITCAGVFDKKIREYDERTVVSAKLESSLSSP